MSNNIPPDNPKPLEVVELPERTFEAAVQRIGDLQAENRQLKHELAIESETGADQVCCTCRWYSEAAVQLIGDLQGELRLIYRRLFPERDPSSNPVPLDDILERIYWLVTYYNQFGNLPLGSATGPKPD